MLCTDNFANRDILVEDILVEDIAVNKDIFVNSDIFCHGHFCQQRYFCQCHFHQQRHFSRRHFHQQGNFCQHKTSVDKDIFVNKTHFCQRRLFVVVNKDIFVNKDSGRTLKFEELDEKNKKVKNLPRFRRSSRSAALWPSPASSRRSRNRCRV